MIMLWIITFKILGADDSRFIQFFWTIKYRDLPNLFLF